ncbi:hypothetical protein DA83_16435 [Pseudomonas sp. 250J]|uniref:GNAT family N-acetyltransferase n=1 Tax=Pseudomonas peradeniyensis TaxID=2745488 RepID=A0ABT2VEW8_9PSED|nr:MULTISPECIES: GNAT family N-acetyltransferase [Pseudomonas]KNX79439.1 hypothetical protein DA83_16435 [Pseudomonas sp. 250J]MCU7240256.1 GNAT family N-acetyltransferase [Pseudomonas peradeniyensis]MCU7282591.1 GNAT family N-acetyltransferase [Pseudomonas peradeniyensis]QZA55673.1 GNAT family N-acetyltransferase [Pseudomonas sp. 2hn]
MLIETYDLDTWQVQVFDSIDDLDQSLWDSTLAFHHPFRSHAFMQVVEACFHDRDYRYLVARRPGSAQVAGMLFVTQQDLDLMAEAPAWLRRGVGPLRRLVPRIGMLRVAMLGCFETAGQHWWVAPEHDQDELFALLVTSAERALPQARVHVVRDLDRENASHAAFDGLLHRRGFRHCHNYPLALIHLHGLDWAGHYARLKANSRKILKKALSSFETSGYRVLHHEGEVPGLERLYELYVCTHRHATEYQREQLPLAFLQRLQGSDQAVFSVLLDPNDRAVAFVLSGVGERVINPFLFGRDYAVDLPVNAYYVLHIDLLRRFASPATERVDLGITNYFVKQNLGSQLSGSGLYLKLKNPVLNRILGPHVAEMFDIKQPGQRRIFRASAQSDAEPAGPA